MTDLAADALEVVARSAEARAGLRGQFPADRDDRLTAVLDDLTVAMEPIRARLLQAPCVGRSDFEPELRTASKIVSAERAKVRSMLTGKVGGRPRPESAEPPEKFSAQSFDKSMNRYTRDVLSLEDQADVLARVARRRLPYKAMFELREDIEELRADVRKIRDSIRDRQAMAWAWSEHKRPTPSMYLRDTQKKADTLLGRLAEVARRLARMARNAGRRKIKALPERRKWRTWTEGDARAAIDAWAAEHGHRPRARDLTDPELPSLGTVQKLLGGVPG